MQKLIIFGSILFLVLLFSCATGIKKTQELVVFPSPPDTARIQFLRSYSNSIDVTGEQSPFIKFIMGKDKSKEIIKPYGISVKFGKMYICDVTLKSIIIIDLKEHTYEIFSPKGMGQLKKPIGCFVDEDSILYVADILRRQIVAFDKYGNYINSCTKDSLKPFDVCVYDDKIWVPDSKSHKVHVFSKSTFKYIRSFPEVEPNAPGFLYSPSFISIKEDRVYINDFGDFKIKIYSTSGNIIDSVGSYGKFFGQFVRPKGIAVDNELNLYVADMGFENVQMFGPDGKLLMFFGGAYQGRGYMYMPAKVVIDYDNLEYFQKYVDDRFNLKFLIFVTNQFGPEKISVYGFVENKTLIE